MAGTTFKCKICGKEFKQGNGRRKICSDECKHKSHLANQRKYLVRHREEITSNQRCDLDNLCIKLVIDGLKLAGIIDDDDPKHIDMITIIYDKTQEFTTVEIHEESL